MKKLFVLLAAVALLAAPAANAQDKMIFNHMSLGINEGLDGTGLQVAFPITDMFNIRAGYSIYLLVPQVLKTEVDLSSMAGKTQRDLSKVPLTLSLLSGGTGNLMFDFYPSKKSTFHLTAGLFIGSGKFVEAKADLTKILHEDEYGTLAIGPEGGPTFSSDQNGYGYIHVKTNSVMPYLGIGFGRPVDPEYRVRVNFDMGLAYWGSPKVVSYNYIANTFNPSSPVKEETITSAAVQNKDQGLLDFMAKFPVFPMLRLQVFFRLF